MSYFNHPLFDILVDTLAEPFASDLRSKISTNDVLGLVDQKVDRNQPVSFDEVFYKEFFRKVSDAPLGIDTAQVALSGFLQTERETGLSNERIRNLRSFIVKNPGHELSVIIRRVREQAKIILGPAPNRLEPRISFGSTVDLKRNSSVFYRLKSPSVSSPVIEFLRSEGIVRSDYMSSRFPKSENPPSLFGALVDDFVIYDYAKLETVPKTALIDRVIVKAPTVDISYQNYLGNEIKSRLSDFGLDIHTSAMKHKELAKQSSLTGDLATIDLRSASDTICTELVRLLLPDDWFHLLSTFRTRQVLIGETLHNLEMFSPAGNGFTFELETLLFYSISLTTSKVVYLSAPPDISVFGDDIILPVIYADNFFAISKICGFVVNKEKSFTKGFFRESCGGDFYNGTDVRGYNAKALPSHPRDWISIANAVRRTCYYNNSDCWRANNYHDLWLRIIQLIPKASRLYGPRHYGDSCINSESTELYTIKNHRWNGEYIKLLIDTGGVYSSVGGEISRSGLKSDLVRRAVTHESLEGHGLQCKEELSFYPDSILTATVGKSYKNKWLPFTLFGQAPEDMDELVSGLTSDNSSFLREPYKVPRIYSSKLLFARRELIDVLKSISCDKMTKLSNDNQSFLSFSFS